jgi:hypothetical protein
MPGAEALRLPEGLSRKPYEAKGFYGILSVAILGGVTLNLLDMNPIAALYYSAIVNGIIAVPMMLPHHAYGSTPRRDGRIHTSFRSASMGVDGDGGDGDMCHRPRP